MNLSIDKVDNGFIVEQTDKQFVFTSFEALAQHLKQKLTKPKQVNNVVVPIEFRYPQAFKDGSD